jgi:hypothetical protein
MAAYCSLHPLRWGLGRPLPQPFASHTSSYPPSHLPQIQSTRPGPAQNPVQFQRRTCSAPVPLALPQAPLARPTSPLTLVPQTRSWPPVQGLPQIQLQSQASGCLGSRGLPPSPNPLPAPVSPIGDSAPRHRRPGVGSVQGLLGTSQPTRAWVQPFQDPTALGSPAFANPEPFSI